MTDWMNFLAEMKRRYVHRVGVAYLAAAWFLIQISDTLTVILVLPFWAPRIILLLLVIGVTPTLIAAWALEVTPEGIKLEKDVGRNKTETVHTGRKLNYFIIGTLVLIIAFLVLERVFLAGDREPPAVTEVTAEPDKSIAVLPFVVFSQNHDQDWFAEGLAEEILNALARTPDLMVSLRTSTFNYKGTDKDISTIACAALAALKSGGEVDRFAATTYVSTAYRLGEASAAANYGLKALERWPNDSGLSYQTHRSLLWAMRVGEAADLIARVNVANAGNRLIRARQACAEGRRNDVLQILEQLRAKDDKSVANE
ncbi:MAG: hypothetical protein GY701_31375, partial [Sulfitobacter sp.]|nr:hypothetical protein [Sulfitobacter sp.]